jgi:hypothetical protein
MNSAYWQGEQKAGVGLAGGAAWGWLRLQPDGELRQCFIRHFAAAAKRVRRIGIVALAGRLAIASLRGPPMAARLRKCAKVYSPLQPCQPCLMSPRRRQLARLRSGVQALVQTNFS